MSSKVSIRFFNWGLNGAQAVVSKKRGPALALLAFLAKRCSGPRKTLLKNALNLIGLSRYLIDRPEPGGAAMLS